MGNIQADLIAQVSVQKLTSPTNSVVSQSLELLDQPYDEALTGYVEVADGAADQAISLGGITTAQVVYIESDQVVSFKLNGSIALTAKSLFMTGAAVTTLTVSNASGELANLEIVLLGT